MSERPRRPDLDEKIGLPEDTDPDDVLRRLLERDEGADTVSGEPDEDDSDG